MCLVWNIRSSTRACLGSVEGSESAHVGVVCECIVDGKVTRVNFVHAVAGVEVRERGYTWSNPSNVEAVSGILSRPIVAIVDHELVFMRMAEEDAGYNVRRESVDNLVKEICIRF